MSDILTREDFVKRLRESTAPIGPSLNDLTDHDAALRAELRKEVNCGRCSGPETTDKDCECGGSGLATDRIRGLYAAIEYFKARALNAEADTKRLDWLSKQKYGCWGVGFQLPSGPWIGCQIETGGEAYQGRTPREAIDAAMTASADTGQDTCNGRCLKCAGEDARRRMIVCAVCGNKRCPKATDHSLECSGSNEPGQKGSVWENYPRADTGQEKP